MVDQSDLANVAIDPRFPPWWNFVGVGTFVAISLVLGHFGFLLVVVFIIGSLLGFLTWYRPSAYPIDEEVKNKLALRPPLPGTMWPIFIGVTLLVSAMSLTSGSWVSMPMWAVVVVAAVTGGALALVARRFALMQIAGNLNRQRVMTQGATLVCR